MAKFKLKTISLNKTDLRELPLFFRTIYSNPLANFMEESKLFRRSANFQTTVLRSPEPSRYISKTFDNKLIMRKESNGE